MVWKPKLVPVNKTFKDLSFFQRHARFLVIGVSTFAILVLFSRPIYDNFYTLYIPGFEKKITSPIKLWKEEDKRES